MRQQGSVVYQPVDVSETALAEATENILNNIPGVTVRCQVADYTREGLPLDRLPNTRTLALYIGSSIGNFTPDDAQGGPAQSSRAASAGRHAAAGNGPCSGQEHKTEATLLAAYDDAAGTTAAFNLNVLTRLNRDLGADFDIENFRHKVLWNPAESRIEMHLESLRCAARPPSRVKWRSLRSRSTSPPAKQFTPKTVTNSPLRAVEALLASASFKVTRSWQDAQHLFAVTLATAVYPSI